MFEAEPLTGQLLIAMPSLEDERFARAVILVCAHTEEGAMGIVLNRPLERLTFEALLRQLEVEPAPPARQIRLCEGGPVDHGRGFVLHSNDWTGDGSLPVAADLALTASLDVLQEIAGGRGPRDGFLALGYASWGPGQLDEELQQNVWLTAPSEHGVLFDADYETKWRRAMAIIRVDPVLLSGMSGHA